MNTNKIEEHLDRIEALIYACLILSESPVDHILIDANEKVDRIRDELKKTKPSYYPT